MEFRIEGFRLLWLNFENQQSTIGNLHSRPTVTAIGFLPETWRNRKMPLNYKCTRGLLREAMFRPGFDLEFFERGAELMELTIGAVWLAC